MLERMWRKVNPPTLLVVQPLWKTLWRFLKKLGINLLYDPAIHYWTYIQRKPIKKDTCTPIFIVALFASLLACFCILCAHPD